MLRSVPVASELCAALGQVVMQVQLNSTSSSALCALNIAAVGLGTSFLLFPALPALPQGHLVHVVLPCSPPLHCFAGSQLRQSFRKRQSQEKSPEFMWTVRELSI